jgi:hypothetical protein
MSDISFTKEDIKGYEAKHITYVTDQFGRQHDAHFVKEIIHLKDGRKIPHLRKWEDYQRPYWITQKGRQNHQEKKDYEVEENLTRYMSSQIMMPSAIAKALNDYSMGPRPRLKQLARSPYLYGADVSSACCLKNAYQTRFPGLISGNTVAGGDIETNVYESDRDGEIICMSVTHKSNVYLAYLKRWVHDIDDPVKETLDGIDSMPELAALKRARGLNVEVEVCETPADIVIQCLKRLHTWKPDFFAFWNIEFDMTRMLKALNDYGVDPKDVFSDESIPTNYRYFHFKKDQAMMTTASGVTKSRGPEDQWHWITAPASFQCIDMMATYRVTRLSKGKEPSYALQRILRKELDVSEKVTIVGPDDLAKFHAKCDKLIEGSNGGYPYWFLNDKQVDCLTEGSVNVGDKVHMSIDFGKLNFPEADHLTGIEWHRFMQTKHKIKYGLYNIIDSMRLEQLDEKINDLERSVTLFSKSSDYKNFSSNPKRLVDDMHFWYLKRGQVIGTSSDQMVHDLDKYVVDHKEWIVTLPSYMAGQHGIRCIKDLPDYCTLIFVHVADLDIVSTYPNVSQILNIARETTVMEFSAIEGVPERIRRAVGVNLTAGRVNSIEITQQVMGAPRLDNLLAAYAAKRAGVAINPSSNEDSIEKKSVPVAA